MNENREIQRQFLTTALSTHLQKALDQSTGAKWTLAPVEKLEAAPSQQPPMFYKIVFKGALSGDCYVQFVAEETKALAAALAKTPPVTNTDLILNIMEAAVTELMLELMGEYGEVELGVETATQLGPGATDLTAIRASNGTLQLSILACMTPPLLESLGKKAQAAAAAPAQTPVHPDKMADLSKAGIDESKLKLILDVELSLTLRFGQRQMTLREILDLNSGSVIELDRQVDEPVELLLDGRVIARGEAVVVDGNYGLRVTELPQPMLAQLAH